MSASSLPKLADGAWPCLGHLVPFARDRLGFLSRCGESEAAVVRIKLPGDIFLLLDALDIKHVLETNYPNYDKGPRLISQRGRIVSGSGLLTSSGQEHLEMRKTLQPAYAASSIMPLASAMVEETDRFLDGWQDNQAIDFAEALSELALSVNGRILFSADYRGADAALAEAIRVRRAFIQHVFDTLLPWPETFATPKQKAWIRAQQLIDQDVRNRVSERRTEPGRFTDLLARLVSMTPDEMAFQEAITTAITGFETIGEGLAWTCLLLSQHPQVQQQLRDEIGKQLADRPPTAEDLPRLPLVGWAINESMRLYPPTWIYVRVARSADRLPSGVDLPARAKLYICPWAIHRSVRYFDDPLRFDPQRFSPEARKNRPKYAYFPFGGGPRICIGMALAKMQMPLLLVRLMQRFNWTLKSHQQIRPLPKITLRPSPAIEMTISSRGNPRPSRS